ncbi:MAG: hypothetical protein HQL21_02000 [Candidatus Omnitrophica bacterium]|nr:hypothetical protein [Candidatus Omnitrophota bacterium]
MTDDKIRKFVTVFVAVAMTGWFITILIRSQPLDSGFQDRVPEKHVQKAAHGWTVASWLTTVLDRDSTGEGLFEERPAGRLRKTSARAGQNLWDDGAIPKISGTLYLAVATDVDPVIVDHMMRALREAYSIDVRLWERPYMVPSDLFAQQINADLLLDRGWPVYQDILSKPGTLGLLIVIAQDMRVEGLNFIFGTADMARRVGVVSIARFSMDHPPQELLLERTTKQVFSTVGFIAGVPRCTTPGCARAYPNSVAEHDLKTTKICNVCLRRFARAVEDRNAP